MQVAMLIFAGIAGVGVVLIVLGAVLSAFKPSMRTKTTEEGLAPAAKTLADIIAEIVGAFIVAFKKLLSIFTSILHPGQLKEYAGGQILMIVGAFLILLGVLGVVVVAIIMGIVAVADS
jgi:hypothetical protein